MDTRDGMIFENWFEQHHDPAIPNECTRLSEDDDQDCIEQGKPADQWCASCSEYVRLCEEFYGHLDKPERD